MTERQPGIQQMHSPRPPSPTVNPPDESVPHSRLNASGKGLRPSTLKLPLLSPTHRIPTPLKSPGFDRELSFNERDHVYNPDPDQMANTLLTVAMVRLGKPLPAEYNSFLLHVLEEYRKMRRQLDAIRVDLQAEVEGRQSDLHVMQVEREAYKAEVKRLERLILDGTNGGPDALALARKGSLLRNGCDNEDSDEKEQTTVSGDSSVKRHQGSKRKPVGCHPGTAGADGVSLFRSYVPQSPIGTRRSHQPPLRLQRACRMPAARDCSFARMRPSF